MIAIIPFLCIISTCAIVRLRLRPQITPNTDLFDRDPHRCSGGISATSNFFRFLAEVLSSHAFLPYMVQLYPEWPPQRASSYFYRVTTELEWILPISKNKLRRHGLTVFTLKFPKARLVSPAFLKKKKVKSKRPNRIDSGRQPINKKSPNP